MEQLKPFSAKINRLLEILTHHVYSEKGIFIRELITNSIDACKKAKFCANNGEITFNQGKVFIKIDKDTITFCDNGVGMTREEMEENLSTIAHSGTREFAQDDKLIGKFGIGFYSSFMVAHRVMVWSKSCKSKKSYVWSSEGSAGYTIHDAVEPFVPEFFKGIKDSYKKDTVEDEEIFYGTQIKLFINKDCSDFLNENYIRNYIKQNMNYVKILIYLQNFLDPINVGEVLWEKTTMTAADHDEIYSQILGGQGSLFTYKRYQKYAVTPQVQHINYKNEKEVSNDYTCLLYVPTKEYYLPVEMPQKPLVKIYANNVFVCDNCDILPPYFRFAKGIVDITDAPVGLTRENIPESPILRAVYSFLPKSLAELILKEKNRDLDNYCKNFYNFYGTSLKEGVCTETPYRGMLLDCLVFYSAKWKKMISLEEYVKDSPEIKEILYTTNKNSAQLDFYLNRNQDVLIMTDDVDNIWPGFVMQYNGYALKSIDVISEKQEISDTQKIVLKELEKILKGKVKSVKLCDNMTGRMASFLNEGGTDYKFAKLLKLDLVPSLGLNSNHKIIRSLMDGKITELEMVANMAFYISEISDSTLAHGVEIVNTLEKLLESWMLKDGSSWQ